MRPAKIKIRAKAYANIAGIVVIRGKMYDLILTVGEEMKTSQRLGFFEI